MLANKHTAIWTIVICIIILYTAISAPARVQAAGNVIGDGSPASCTEAALRLAVQAGDRITFDCGGPKTIILQGQKAMPILKETIIDGGGQITLSGGNQTRVFYINLIGDLTVRNIVLTNSHADGYGGAVWVSSGASFTAENTIIQKSKTNG